LEGGVKRSKDAARCPLSSSICPPAGSRRTRAQQAGPEEEKLFIGPRQEEDEDGEAAAAAAECTGEDDRWKLKGKTSLLFSLFSHPSSLLPLLSSQPNLPNF
jgi:hypothetical protein